MKGASTLNASAIQVNKEGSVASPIGFTAGGLHCGLKRKRKDLGWIYSQVPANAAGVYTTNAYQAAPLKVTQDSIAKEGKLQTILVNSANANACTGLEGLQNAYEMRKMMSEACQLQEHLIAVVSTGVIGVQLPMEKIRQGVTQIEKNRKDKQLSSFEQAILTTDTCTKSISVQFEIDGQTVTIGGAAKGSGMIHPNMATMLGFITTDAAVEQGFLHQLLRQATQKTFNRITVDGDSSTNDMVLLLANGMANTQVINENHPQLKLFYDALTYVCQELAKMIARDGEGATKLVQVKVIGAKTEEDAAMIGKAIVGSSLVKTAIYGADANWGRIVCAIGYSGSVIDPDSVTVKIGQITVVHSGLPTPFSEEEAKKILEKDFVEIEVALKDGNEEAICWGCDLTYDYVRINASYRT